MAHKSIVWKDVKGYEGLYRVSNAGDVLSIARKGNWRGDHLLTRSNDGNGYPQVCMSRNGVHKTIKVYRLVAEAFVPNPNGYKEVNHIDENKWNCEATNLEWCTRAYNINYGERTQKTSTRVAMYSKDGNYIQSFSSIREATRALNKKAPSDISRVIKGERKMAFGFIWKKEETE